MKRKEVDKFIISNSGKAVLGYDETKGINLKAGNGLVVIAVLDKDDPRCSTLLKAHKGNGFTSNTLEAVLQKNNLIADTYEFKFAQEYAGLNYFSIVPVEDATEGEEQAPEEAISEEASADDTAEEAKETPVEEAVTADVSPANDEF